MLGAVVALALAADVVLPPPPFARRMVVASADVVAVAPAGPVDQNGVVADLNELPQLQGCAKARATPEDIVVDLALAPTGFVIGAVVTSAGTGSWMRACVESALTERRFRGPRSPFALTPDRRSPDAPASRFAVTLHLVAGAPPAQSSSVSRREIEEGIFGNGDEVLRCYGRALAARPGLSGTVTFRWATGSDGAVVEVTRVDEAKGGADLDDVAECVRAAIVKFRVATRHGTQLRVTYPFVFEVVPSETQDRPAHQ